MLAYDFGVYCSQVKTLFFQYILINIILKYLQFMSGLKNTNKKQALLQSSRSQSRLNIKKQSQQTEIFDFSLNSKNKLRSQQSLLTCPNKNKKSLDQSKGSLLYELTAKERQMISDLSKIFVAQNPNRKKISIKINQIKRCHLKNEDCQGCLNCRIDRIQITRLPDSGKIEIPEVIPQFKHIPQISEVLFEINTSSENKMSALKKSGIQFKQRMRSKSKFKSLKIIRTIAITYRPQYSECNYSHIRSFNKAPFIKFRQGSGRESPKSNVSINQDMLFDDQLSQNSTQEKNNTQEKNKAQGNELAFIKILDLNSFVRRKHVERQMLGISNAANQKISVQYKKLKEMLSQQRNEFNHKIQELTKHNQKLNAQLQNERAQKAKFYEQVQNLKKSLKQVREVKQIFLRQNNNLKEKIKQNDKTIQEMRRELNRIRNGELPNHTNLNKINSTKNLVDCSKKIPTHDRNYLTQMEKSNTFNLQLKQPSKIAASSCTRSITRRIQPKRDNKEQNSNQSSAKSQRTIGIRKNSPSVNVNLVQQKNQIIIANNYDTDYVNSSHMYASKDEKQIRSIKSVSNYSELSSSISQSVGYVKKPADEAHKGMLVDYMLQEPNEKNDDLPKQSERQNGQFRQQSNRATGPPRERFQYKSIK